ncbi:MAG: F0F1 ATP synthase subunit B, partial [Mycobacteriales bacterium]
MHGPALADSVFILPNATIFAELFAFLIVLFVLRRYVVPPLTKAMEARQTAIRTQIEEAERARMEAQSTLEDYRAQLAEARAEANRLREEAREQGRAIIEELRVKAQEEAA